LIATVGGDIMTDAGVEWSDSVGDGCVITSTLMPLFPVFFPAWGTFNGSVWAKVHSINLFGLGFIQWISLGWSTFSESVFGWERKLILWKLMVV
jgi:hypothetical protein